jgi:RpiB/LacA/LacB family sugar-phosphate isomerase
MNKKLLLVPIGGKGQRFRDCGYTLPKQLLPGRNKELTCIEESLNNIIYYFDKVIFILNKQDAVYFNLINIYQKMFDNKVEILVLQEETIGPIQTIHNFESYLRQYEDHALYIHTLDVDFGYVNLNDCLNKDVIFTFKSNSPNYSYSKILDNGRISVKEKEVISNDASAGLYVFRSVDWFFFLANKYYSNLKAQGFHIAPIYNFIVDKVELKEVDHIYIFGTPEEYNFYRTIPNYNCSKDLIGIAYDHSGINKAAQIFETGPYNFVCGDIAKDITDYADYASSLCSLIQDGYLEYGFACCRSGQGMNIFCNKQKNIRSVLIHTAEEAKIACEHNAPNVFCIPDKVSLVETREIIQNIKTSKFKGGRHQNRLIKCENYN